MIIDRGFFFIKLHRYIYCKTKKSLMHFIPSYKALHLLHKNDDKGKLHLKKKQGKGNFHNAEISKIS